MFTFEDVILELRLNILNDHVTKFIITEGEYDHRGIKRKLNLNRQRRFDALNHYYYCYAYSE